MLTSTILHSLHFLFSTKCHLKSSNTEPNLREPVLINSKQNTRMETMKWIHTSLECWVGLSLACSVALHQRDILSITTNPAKNWEKKTKTITKIAKKRLKLPLSFVWLVGV